MSVYFREMSSFWFLGNGSYKKWDWVADLKHIQIAYKRFSLFDDSGRWILKIKNKYIFLEGENNHKTFIFFPKHEIICLTFNIFAYCTEYIVLKNADRDENIGIVSAQGFIHYICFGYGDVILVC